jgi:TolB-like protein
MLVAAILLTLAVTLPTRAVAADRVQITLLPMVVHSAESPEYVRAGLADMLASRLERVPDFEVSRVEDPSKATTNLTKALRIGRDKGASFVVFGSFTRFGTGASLDITCTAINESDSDDPLRDIFIHSGTLGDVIPDLDDLVGKVARFVIDGYVEERGGTAAAVAGLPTTREIGELKARIGSLEQSLQALTAQLESADVLPEDPTEGAGADGEDGGARVAVD